ncbi:ORF MSV187 putative late transcription factor VLTF-2 homolog (vaccinia A1L), similar to SW:P33814 [Melanoplus sanguinipes entomopoxvirus]|uniref:ORF MSV187 putative late transcription factor VLTF-2 homolog (Vaccinia A1L), similar to SW:P33814 n=1 Tax=Melanoplus sanguinipes entomopoxvirus TaxID=83191 RepID=Q9YVQ5_MSEPV|nr:ORF MSV187 putative late transcription factor VLTF-2 homolog (vaccinia A1L), similar to SW:P33814 [Melanoplus sanguinipes entomopoxvirus]AAC97694.1 ORF MSV187 putative late transcription factor VLTF-2 homolog (vaccinia A1L), similar to SW:P33814 [Melanoplus sanguinipes entomopoxvirus 'O']
MNEYKTDFTKQEISEAALNLIKDLKSMFYEIHYIANQAIINDSIKCIYCNDECYNGNVFNIKENSINIGYFCSNICRDIFYSIIQFIFNIPPNKVNFIPFQLLNDNSKEDYNVIKKIFKNIDYKNLILFSKYNNEQIISNFKIILKNNKIWHFTYKFNFETKINKCLNCGSEEVDKDIILLTKYKTLQGFCSVICKDNICKQVYYTLIPKYKYLTYSVPTQLLKNVDVKTMINKLKNKSNVYGGYTTYDSKNIKLEYFTPN